MFGLPFGLMPGHWGLRGEIRDQARIEYEVSDPELRETKLAKLRIKDEKALGLELLEIKKRYDSITENEYDKQKATLEGNPWMTVINSDYDHEEGLGGLTFEFDWNDHFVEFLRENKFEGLTDEDVVENYFNELCKQIAIQEDLVEYINTDPSAPERAPGTVIKKNASDGRSEYS